MDLNPDFKELLRVLNETRVRYLVVGGYAYSHYQSPRNTKDLDIWVEANPENAIKTWTALKQFGAPLADMKVEDFASQRFIYHMGLEPNRIDVLTTIDGVDFGSAWRNRERTVYERVPMLLISKDDLIKAKLAAGRPQDLLDVEMLKASGKRRRNARKK